MSGDAWITLAVVAATVAVLASERISPPVVVLGGVTVLLATDVIDAQQAFSGFSNPAPITVAALYVLAGAAESTGALELVTARILPSGPSSRGEDRGVLFRLVVPTAAVSGFLNNTPIVAMLAPAVMAWARRTGRPVSRYLMPISFAAILGGLLTLIGTSTNLVVSGLLKASGQAELGLFEIGKVGLPIAAGGACLLVLLTPRLMARRTAPSEDFRRDARDFVVEMRVQEKSSLAGKTVFEAGLRNLQGVYLVEIEREGHSIAPVSPDDVLNAQDRLTFAGDIMRILDLQRISGMVSAEERHFSVAAAGSIRFFEAVVAEGSPLAGSTLKDVGFRAHYDAAVLAIHRAGERITAKLGEVALRPGDVLLVLADQGFKRRWLERRDFLVIAPLDGEKPPRREKAAVVGIVMASLLLVVGTGLMDILEASLLAAFALVAAGTLSPTEARNAIDLNVIAVIAGSFGLGAAIASSGLAEEVASTVIDPLAGLGDIGVLAGVLLSTMVLTELITNNAAAVLMFPIAVAVASQAGLDPRPFAIAVALGASASFLTPIGYQTNTMVYGMGGYRYSDFGRLGFPLTITVIVLGLIVIPIFWPLA